MRAIVREKFGGPNSLVVNEIPEPQPEPGHVIIQVTAFGVDHAEMHMRRGERADAAPVSGIDASDHSNFAHSLTWGTKNLGLVERAIRRKSSS
jgi:NADPH:quinone reductase-like Zn-dependent oxidoreductase